jgi:type IV pilus assembly protein PilA
MKTELKAKFLQHLVGKKKKNEGFTLIELLVVVIIIGILAAIALPSMLSQAQKARTGGALSQAGAVNRAQQAYRLEHTDFTDVITELKIGAAKADIGAYSDPALSARNATNGTVTYAALTGVDAKSVTGEYTADAQGNTTTSVTAAQ